MKTVSYFAILNQALYNRFKGISWQVATSLVHTYTQYNDEWESLVEHGIF